MTVVHQLLPTFAGRDAIGSHCLRVQALLRNAGFDSEIYALDIHDDVADAAHHADDYTPAPGEWALYHFSIGSPLLDFVRTLDVNLALDYHNITDAKYFRRWAPIAADRMDEGRAQLAAAVPDVRFALAKSHYSEAELRALGYNRTSVAPVLVDFHADDSATAVPNRTWLSVGRLAPNKCPHDVIAAFAVYRNRFDPHATLALVGDRHSAMEYTRACERLAADLGVAEAVTFTGSVSPAQLHGSYRAADVFVSCSEHEGFGVPVLEAMHFDLPVVAYAAAATPEIVGDGGLLLDNKDPLVVATAVNKVLTDDGLRDELVAAGRKRVEAFDLPVTGPRFVETLRTMMDEP
jgi:glycosyltransferase involved in cell wall biosynthesis